MKISTKFQVTEKTLPGFGPDHKNLPVFAFYPDLPIRRRARTLQPCWSREVGKMISGHSVDRLILWILASSTLLSFLECCGPVQRFERLRTVLQSIMLLRWPSAPLR